MKSESILKLPLFALILVLGATCSCQSLAAANRPEVWFSPDNQTPDFLDLFAFPDQWQSARSHISVFEFGAELLNDKSPLSPVSFESLRRVHAFYKLKKWGIKIAVEEMAIKEPECSIVRPVAITTNHLVNMQQNNTPINIVAMNGPLSLGTVSCNLTINEAAAETVAYTTAILRHAKVNHVPEPSIGDIEPYPSSSVSELEQWTTDLEKRHFKPAFIHLDVNVHYLDVHPHISMSRDFKELKQFYGAKSIPFGIVIWSGYSPLNSDRSYYEHAIAFLKRIKESIGSPRQLVFQSWVTRSSGRCSKADASCSPKGRSKLPCGASDPTYCGMKSIPLNLPESAPYTHTRLILDSLSILN